MRKLLLALALLLAATPALAQGCGPSNPNCVVPLRPAGDSSNAAASTAFIAGQQLTVGSPLTVGNFATQNVLQLFAEPSGMASFIGAAGIDTNINLFLGPKGSGIVQVATSLGVGTVGGNGGQIFLNGTTSGTSSIGVNATGQLFWNARDAILNITPAGGNNGTIALGGMTSGSAGIFTSNTGNSITLSPNFGANTWAFINDGTAFASSSSSGRPQVEMQNTTSDVNSSQVFMIKSRSGGNTLSGDVLGAVAVDGFANGGFQATAAIQFVQAAASSGSNIPSSINFFISSASGQQNTVATFRGTDGAFIVPATLSTGTNGGASGVVSFFGSTSGSISVFPNAASSALTIASVVNGGQLFLNGATSGGASLQPSATGGHLGFVGSTGIPTNSACTGFALASGSTDIAGRVTYTSATTCTINFGATYGTAPYCTVSPATAASTVLANASTTQLAVTFGTAQTAFNYYCPGV